MGWSINMNFSRTRQGENSLMEERRRRAPMVLGCCGVMLSHPHRDSIYVCPPLSLLHPFPLNGNPPGQRSQAADLKGLFD